MQLWQPEAAEGNEKWEVKVGIADKKWGVKPRMWTAYWKKWGSTDRPRPGGSAASDDNCNDDAHTHTQMKNPIQSNVILVTGAGNPLCPHLK